MKMYTILLLSLIITISSCGDDEITENTMIPTEIYITSIDVTDYPDTKDDGSTWDIANGSPDLQIQVYTDNNLIDDSGIIYPDADPGDRHLFQYSGIDIDLQTVTTIMLIDGDLTGDDIIGRIDAVLYRNGDTLENRIDLSDGGLSVTVGLRYVF